jgi:pantothenate kinase
LGPNLARNSKKDLVTEPAHGDIETIADHLRRRLAEGKRCLVGITGPPGVGKSTFTEQLASRFTPAPPVVGMDGFHLAHEYLVAQGLVHRKGAHYTFDAWGYVGTIRRISQQGLDEVVFAPRFDRSIEDSIAAAVPVSAEDRLILTEGNYLLLDIKPWHQLRSLLDLTIYLELDEEVRLERLIRRHVEFGKSQEHAERHVRESDQANARLIAGSRHHADFVVDCSGAG